MSNRFVAIAGALVILLAVLGLAVDQMRAGPIAADLEPVVVPVAVEGTYHAQEDRTTLGICPPPETACGPATAIDLRLVGLPDLPFQARLQGDTAEALGPLERAGGSHVIQWQEEVDHTDKERIVLVLAGRDLGSIPVRPSTEPLPVSLVAETSWDAPPATVHLDQIGAVSVSAVAEGRVAQTPPPGWSYVARLQGKDAGASQTDDAVDLGALETDGDHAVLDSRVERVHLTDHERIVILAVPDDAPGGPGFPILAAPI